MVRVNWGTLYPRSSVSDAIISANRSPLFWRWAFIICSLAWSVLEGLCHAWLQRLWLYYHFSHIRDLETVHWGPPNLLSHVSELSAKSIFHNSSSQHWRGECEGIKIQNQLVYMEVVGHQSQSNRWISGCILNHNIHLLSLLYFLHVSPLLARNTTVLHINKLLQKCCKLYVD